MSKDEVRGMKDEKNPPQSDSLFQRVASILEEARNNVVHSVNSNMVLAYWLIGREIVQALQGGEKRAEYGKQVVKTLSSRLMARYDNGFSVANLKNFRQFYQTYSDRLGGIGYPAGSQLAGEASLVPSGKDLLSTEKSYPSGSEFPHGFSPQLSWSHYRALMRVQGKRPARPTYYSPPRGKPCVHWGGHWSPHRRQTPCMR